MLTVNLSIISVEKLILKLRDRLAVFLLDEVFIHRRRSWLVRHSPIFSEVGNIDDTLMLQRLRWLRGGLLLLKGRGRVLVERHVCNGE